MRSWCTPDPLRGREGNDVLLEVNGRLGVYIRPARVRANAMHRCAIVMVRVIPKRARNNNHRVPPERERANLQCVVPSPLTGVPLWRRVTCTIYVCISCERIFVYVAREECGRGSVCLQTPSLRAFPALSLDKSAGARLYLHVRVRVSCVSICHTRGGNFSRLLRRAEACIGI